jgi:hypothetical protein
MEHLCKVHDGSEHEVGRDTGYISGRSRDRPQTVIHLYLEVHSQEAKDFLSEGHQFFKVIDKASLYAGNKGICAIDRGGDGADSSTSSWKRGK